MTRKSNMFTCRLDPETIDKIDELVKILEKESIGGKISKRAVLQEAVNDLYRKHTGGKKKQQPTNKKFPKTQYREHVRMYPEEYEKLVNKLGKEATERKIDDLDDYIAMTGKSYKDHYRTVLNFAKRDQGSDRRKKIVELLEYAERSEE